MCRGSDAETAVWNAVGGSVVTVSLPRGAHATALLKHTRAASSAHVPYCRTTVLQLYIDRARLDEQQPGGFDLVKGLVDVGDIVGCAGGVKRTDKGELSVVGTSLQVGAGRGALPGGWVVG